MVCAGRVTSFAGMPVGVARALPPRLVLRHRQPPSLATLCALAVIPATVAAAVAAAGATAHVELVAAARAFTVGVPIAVGIYAWRRRPENKFGALLLTAGGLWFVASMAESSSAVLYSIGRAGAWAAQLMLVYLVLSFPAGRLTDRRDRPFVWAIAGLFGLLYVPTLLLAQEFPVPNPFASCVADCPPNAFFALDSEPGYVGAVIVPLREVLTIMLFVAATIRLTQRLETATRLVRRALAPALGVAIAWASILAIAMATRRWEPDSVLLPIAKWLLAFALAALAIGYLVGLASQRLSLAGAVQQLAMRIGGHPDPGELRSALADVFEDPSLELAFCVDDGPGGWADAHGRPVRLPPPGGGRCVSPVRGDDGVMAAIVHDEALRDQRDLVATAGAYLATALENARLAAQVDSSRRELRSSRARIAAAADAERKRIERDLHDGAQQRLVALRIELELVQGLIERDKERGLQRLHQLGDEVGETLDEIRSLAHGVYPPLLADCGLPAALREVALRAPVATTVAARGVGRHPPQIESAVYFSVLEALQNAAKHAGGARHCIVTLAEGRDLRFAVRDDGAGFDPRAVPAGAGLANIRDRLAAVGGVMQIDSAPGRGTVLSGRVPLATGDRQSSTQPTAR